MNHSRLVAIILVVCSSIPSTLLGQTDKTDAYVTAEMKRRSIPGLALAVIRHGKVIKMRGYGLANVELGAPVHSDTVFDIASVTKQFTATAILLLMEEGKIRLDDQISRYLPNTPEAWKLITVRHLLTHTAGFPGIGFEFKTLPERRNYYTTAQMFKAATENLMSFAPGEQWRYSNVGYFLLGMIIEKASGQSYREFVTERFFKPLNMAATSVPDQWAIIKNRADGYTLRDGELVHNRRRALIQLPSSGGILSTVKDLVRWDAVLESGKLVKRSSLELMWTAVRLNDGTTHPYGFGWFVDERRGHSVISHAGSTGAEYSRYPDHGLTVIVLSNLGPRNDIPGVEVDAWGITEGVAAQYISGLRLSLLREEPDHNPERTQQLRGFLRSIAYGDDSPLLTLGLVTSLNLNLKNITATRLKKLASFTFITCEDVRWRVVARYGERINHICYYKMKTASDTHYYTFWMTAEERVADFQSATE
jgi:CubicO group peptidase (beta-lactamase class C family)